MIKFSNVDRQYQADKEEYLDIVNQVYSSGQVIAGPHTKKLEQNLSKRFNRKHAVLLGSCTDALYHVGNEFNEASKFSEHGRVIYFPLMSFLATTAFSNHADDDVEVKFIDVDHNCNIDLDKLEEELLKDINKFKTLVWVNLFGNPVDYDHLVSLAKKYNVFLVEDAAQSLGAKWNRTPSGKMGMVSCFSFDPTKNLNAFGLGGAVLTDSDDIAGIVRHMHKPNSKLAFSAGYNSQIDELSAAIVNWKLENRFDQWQRRREKIAEHYIKTFGNLVYTLELKREADCSWHKFIIKHSNRYELKEQLHELGIETKVHYPYTLSNKKEYQNTRAQALSKTVLSLPIYPELTDDEIDFIAQSVKKLV